MAGRPRSTPLVSVVTNDFAWRIYKLLEGLNEEAHAGLTNQEALARVLIEMTHAPPVSDRGELEWMGQHAYDAARHHFQRKIQPAERWLKRKCSEGTTRAKEEALADLRRALYTLPLPESVPPRRPARSEMDIDRDGTILALKAERAVLRQNPDEAKREQERSAVAMVAAVVAYEEAAASS